MTQIESLGFCGILPGTRMQKPRMRHSFMSGKWCGGLAQGSTLSLVGWGYPKTLPKLKKYIFFFWFVCFGFGKLENGGRRRTFKRGLARCLLAILSYRWNNTNWSGRRGIHRNHLERIWHTRSISRTSSEAHGGTYSGDVALRKGYPFFFVVLLFLFGMPRWANDVNAAIYLENCAGYWDKFYRNNENKFFKVRMSSHPITTDPSISSTFLFSQDRHYLPHQFALLKPSDEAVRNILPLAKTRQKCSSFESKTCSEYFWSAGAEPVIACGLSLSLNPTPSSTLPISQTKLLNLSRWKENSHFLSFYLSLSPFSLLFFFGLLKANPQYDTKRCKAFVCDITSLGEGSLLSHIEKESVDVVLMIFVMSAIAPEKMPQVLQTIYSVNITPPLCYCLLLTLLLWFLKKSDTQTRRARAFQVRVYSRYCACAVN